MCVQLQIVCCKPAKPSQQEPHPGQYAIRIRAKVVQPIPTYDRLTVWTGVHNETRQDLGGRTDYESRDERRAQCGLSHGRYPAIYAGPESVSNRLRMVFTQAVTSQEVSATSLLL